MFEIDKKEEKNGYELNSKKVEQQQFEDITIIKS